MYIEQNCKHHDHKPKEYDVQVIQRLQSFKGMTKLKKAAMNMLVKMVDRKRLKDLKAQFAEMDKD